MAKPGYLTRVGTRIDMKWLERIACADIDADAFSVDGLTRLGPVQFELLARCDRCPVKAKCEEMHTNMHRASPSAVIAAGRIYGTTHKPPYSRPLTPAERKRYNRWLDNTTTAQLLW